VHVIRTNECVLGLTRQYREMVQGNETGYGGGTRGEVKRGGKREEAGEEGV